MTLHCIVLSCLSFYSFAEISLISELPSNLSFQLFSLTCLLFRWSISFSASLVPSLVLSHRAAIGEKDVEAGSEDEFDLREYLQSNAAASDDAGIKHKKVGVTFENLTVLGADSVELNIRTFQDALLGNVLWLPMKIASLFGVGKPGSRKLLDDFTGCVKPGEMVLVLGRPGSGVSSS